MKKDIIVILLFIFTFNSYCQDYILKGVVKDSLQNPLSYANVVTEPVNKSTDLKFAITDEKGRYKIELQKGDYTIKVSYLGFISKTIPLSIKNNTIKDFILTEKNNNLEEVVIEMPVIVKQDTITYNTDKFTNGNERKLKNILKKLPGIEVEKNGAVTILGKKVIKMLVEGKPFFGGDTKLGVNNIPADAVDKVVVLDNYNEVSFLKNVSDSEDMAMNIILKEDKKKFVFGDIAVGKGNKDFYRTHSNLFYYSPKTTLNFIGNLNNTGEKTFTFKDYINFNGGINSIFQEGFSNILNSTNNLSQFLDTQDFLKSNNKFAGLNLSKNANEVLDISGFGIFSYSKINSLENNINEYTTFTEKTNTNINSKNIFGIGKLKIDYIPSSEERLFLKTQFKKTNNTHNKLHEIEIDNIFNSIKTEKNDNQFYISQNVEWHKKASNKHTFSSSINFDFTKSSPTTLWKSTKPILQKLIPLKKEDLLTLKQLKNTQNISLKAILKHYWVLNNTNHIYTTLGTAFSKQKYISNAMQLLSNGNINIFDNNLFNNDLDYKFNDLFLGLHYKFKKGNFTFKQGFFVRNYNWNLQQSSSIKNNKTFFLPNLTMKLDFNKSERLKLEYNLKSSFSNALQFSNKFQLYSYNSVYKGNSNLENELYHSVSLGYNKFSLFRGLMLFTELNYMKKDKGLQNNIKFEGINQFLTTELLNNPETQWNFNANIRKKIKQINYTLKGKFKNYKYLQNINNSITTNRKNTYTLGIAVKTLYKNIPTIQIGYDKTIGNYISNNNTSKFINNKSFINIDYDFNNFVFSFEYQYFDYSNKKFNLQNKYQLAQASLLYQKENSPWSFEINTKNLFNSKFRNQNSFSDYIITDNKKFIQPFSILFSVNYKL